VEIYEIHIDIVASPNQVWNAIADFDNYGAWNPIIPFAKGELIANGYLSMRLRNASNNTNVKVLTVNDGKCFILSRFIIHEKLINMVHHFQLSEVDEFKTRFTQRWECTGLLVPLMWKRISSKLKAFELANLELKKHIEGGCGGRQCDAN
jgi:hypothetical protein